MLIHLVNKIRGQIKKYLILGVVILVGLFGLKACRKVQKTQDKQASSTVLQPGQQERIVVDPTKHTITVVTKNGSSTTYLSDRQTQVIEDSHGKLSIIDHKFGTEIRPFLGAGGDLELNARIHTGVDFFYFRKLDLGVGLSFNPTQLKDTRLALNLSYNFYSNTSVALSIDNHHVPGLFLKVHF